MSSQFVSQVKSAIAKLNPDEVRELAERPISIGLVAADSAGFAAMEDFLCPQNISRNRRFELVKVLHRIGQAGPPEHLDLEIWQRGLPHPPDAFAFDPEDPSHFVREVLHAREDLALSLARQFTPFRKPVIARVVKTIARENALFALMTALPDVLPSFFELPWAVGEFASDTAFLTMNQVRMAFLIAAASDQDVGYSEQKAQIASIVGGAFGWRALARELVGKIPFGGGLAPKAAISYAGTYVVGIGLERFYRIGYGLTRSERKAAYEEAFARGKAIVSTLLEAARSRQSENGRELS